MALGEVNLWRSGLSLAVLEVLWGIHSWGKSARECQNIGKLWVNRLRRFSANLLETEAVVSICPDRLSWVEAFMNINQGRAYLVLHFTDNCRFYKLQVCDNTVSQGTFFQRCVLTSHPCHIWITFTIFQTHSLLLNLLIHLWSVLLQYYYFNYYGILRSISTKDQWT